MADDQSSIPSVVDGLDSLQRLILLCALKKPFYHEIEEFRGYVAAQPVYRDGKQNLVTTMLDMAQNYVGSNNINLLQPFGCLGECRATGLSPITKYLFHESDEPLLKCLLNDVVSDEPPWLMPVIPMVLVNGSQGIGANYNPREVIANVMRQLKGEESVPMEPWYKGFKGTIHKVTTTSYITMGVVEERKLAPNTLFITELPIGSSAEDYEKFLEAAAHSEERFIQEYISLENCNDGTLTFQVVMSPDQMNKARQEGFLNKFKLITNLNTNNMHLLNAKGVKKNYFSPQAILKEFFHIRLKYYKKRKLHLLEKHQAALLQLESSTTDVEYAKWTVVDKLRVVDELRVLGKLRVTSPEELWLEDLNALMVQLNEQEESEVEKRKKWKPVFESDSETESDSESEEEPSKEEQDENEAEKREKWISDSESEEEEPSEEQDSEIRENWMTMIPSMLQDKDEVETRKKRKRE